MCTLFGLLKHTIMKGNIWFIMVIWLLGLTFMLNAQTEKAFLTQLAEKEKTAVEALVLYPEDTRQAILEAAKAPEALIKMEGMQQQTSHAFAKLLEGYPKAIQEDIWDLTRYPDLIAHLVLEGDRSANKIKSILQNYPEIIHQRALRAGVDYYLLLEKVDALQQSSALALQTLLNTYPQTTKNALELLIDLPEVLTILTENIRLTILVGDAYQKDPDWVWHKADSLNLVVARQRAEDLEEWKQKLEDNPDAVAELKNTASSYAEEYGYDDIYYDNGDDIYYENEVETVVVQKHYYHHFPYWFGYPSWYVYPRWRPYPLWHDWGFYVQPTGSIIVIGFPSYYITNWYFHHPHHWYHYPHLTDHFVDYYYGHRRSTGSIVAGVDDWIKTHQPVLGSEALANPQGRVDRIRDLGKMEEARINYNRRNPDKAVSQRDYLDKNARRYPNLSRTAPPASSRSTPKEANPTQRKAPKPTVKNDRINRERTTGRLTVPKPKTRTQPDKTDYGRIDKAKDVHRQNWEKTSPTAKPRTTPPKVNTPRKQVPKTIKPNSRKIRN